MYFPSEFAHFKNLVFPNGRTLKHGKWVRKNDHFYQTEEILIKRDGSQALICVKRITLSEIENQNFCFKFGYVGEEVIRISAKDVSDLGESFFFGETLCIFGKGLLS